MKDIYLERILLDNYRNFAALSLHVTNGSNIIIGENGSGKTNILESISLLSAGKGLKSANFNDVCRYDNDYWHTKFNLYSKLGAAELITNFHANGKTRTINYNGSKISSSELANLLNLIWITPQMEGLFTGAASVRRKFLDRLTYNFNAKHANNLSKYEYFMRERSKVLSQRDWQSQQDWLSILENKMIDEALCIEQSRQNAVRCLQKAINDINTDFPKANLLLSSLFEQKNQENDIRDAYQATLCQNREKDSYSTRTSFGVHRSDLLVMHYNKKQPAKICSTGEQKAMLVSIILSAVEAVAQQTQSTPILLLDEIFIHLDQVRQKQLEDYIISTKLQTFITATDIVGIETLAKKSNIIAL